MKSYFEIITEQKPFRDPNEEDYRELAEILEKQYGHLYTLEQSKEVGDGLIYIYTTLANGRKITAPKEIKGH